MKTTSPLPLLWNLYKGSGRISASWATKWVLMCTQSIQLCLFKLICEVPKQAINDHTSDIKSTENFPLMKTLSIMSFLAIVWLPSHTLVFVQQIKSCVSFLTTENWDLCGDLMWDVLGIIVIL